MIFKPAPRPSISDVFDSRRGAPAPWERVHFQPDDPAPGTGGAPAPGATPAPTPTPKTYTDAELNAILAKERRTSEANTAKAIAEAKAAADAQLAELNEKLELAGKSAEEKARIQAEQAAKKIEADRAAAEKRAADAEASAKASNERVAAIQKRYAATSALTEAKAFPQALADALPSFLGAVEIDLDETGEVAAVRYGGVAKKNLKEAAAEFLKERPYFAAAPAGGGAGTPRPNGGAPPGTKLQELSSSELWGMAAKTPPKGAAGPFATPDDDT